MFVSKSVITWRIFASTSLFVSGLVATSPSAKAQLNFDGQTGAYITPLAYTSPSPEKGFGNPQLGVHYLSGGDVVGNHTSVSATIGYGKKLEFGVSGVFASAGSSPSLSGLFDDDSLVFHAKYNLVAKNKGGNNSIPAISIGGALHTGVKRGGAALSGKNETLKDLYLVATKVLPLSNGKLPLVLSGGVKGTDASILGLAGKASSFKACAFGTVAVVLSGPRLGGTQKSQFIVGGEYLQNPKGLDGLPGVVVPATKTLFVRVVPNPAKPLNIDFGLARVAGQVAPGADLRARNRFALGLSYSF